MRNKIDHYVVLYYVAIIALILICGIIIFKLLFISPCSNYTQNACIVDGWSIAGLAATVLGIAATVLAFLGAFAVAYWWTKLDQKVNKQVKKRIDKEIDRRLKEQEQKFLDQISRLKGQIAPLETNVQKATAQITQLDAQISKSETWFTSQITQLETQLLETKKTAIISATLVDPWRAEEWVHEILAVEHSSEAAFRLVRSYLKIVEEILPDPTSVGSYVLSSMKKRDYYSTHGPSGDPLYYWNQALKWQQIVDDQPNQPYSKVSAKAIDHLRLRVEAYQKQQSNSIN